MLGAGDKATELVGGTCSEFAENKKMETSERRDKFVKKIKEANMKVLKEAAQKKRTEETQKELEEVIKTEGDVGLEKKSIRAFESYKEKASNLAKKTKITERDRIELERAKNAFDAVKKAKRTIQKKKRFDKMKITLVKEGGLKKVEEEVEEATDELDAASRKVEEFPEDEQANIEVEVAEAKVEAIADAAEEVIETKTVGVSEITKVKKIIRKCKEKRAYNTMWKDAKILFQKGDKEELKTMMETVEENFKEKESQYNEAVRKKALKLKEIGILFDKALTQYNASLNIRFDLDEWKQKIANKLNIEISTEKKNEIKETVKYLK